MKNASAVILAGGASRRMGRDKALLRLGSGTFLERIIESLNGFEEVLLSGSARRYERIPLCAVEDEFDRCGPVSGLYSALKACNSKWLLAVSCDMPFLTREFAQYLVSCADDAYDAVVPVARDGRAQPLCAVYSKRIAPVLETHLSMKMKTQGGCSVKCVLREMKVKYVFLRNTPYADAILQNVNTPEQYALCRDAPPVIAVCGVKNSGKTTLLEGVLPILKKQGLRVAVIKHDGHDFTPDVPGTDSFRLREAGAYGAAAYSAQRYMLTVERPSSIISSGSSVSSSSSAAFLEEAVAAFRDADLILLEGGKQAPYPKIEVVRAAVSDTAVCPLDSLMGICTDTDIRHPRHTLSLDDYDGVAALLR